MRSLIIWFGIGLVAVATAGGALAQNTLLLARNTAKDNDRAPDAQQRLRDRNV
jgi:hypothetical protein